MQLDGQNLPLLYISPGQINVQLLSQLDARPYTLVIMQGGQPGPTMAIDISPSAPQIFVYAGTGRAIAQNQDWSLNGSEKPARPGEFVTVYVNGIGALQYGIPQGVASSDKLNICTLPHSATVGGKPAITAFLGLTPGLVAVGQANVAIPKLETGDHPLVLTIGGVASNPATVSVAN